MIPEIPELDGYILTPDGKELRTPLQQIEKNKDDIKKLQESGSDIIAERIEQLKAELDQLSSAVKPLSTAIQPDRLNAGTDRAVVFWRQDQQRFAAGFPTNTLAASNTIPVRNASGAIRVGYQTGILTLAANIQTVEDAISLTYVNYFTSSKYRYSYASNEGRLSAYGWRPEDTNWGYITSFPDKNLSESRWYCPIVNASKSLQYVTLENVLRYNDEYNAADKLVSIFTDKVDNLGDTGTYGLRLRINGQGTIRIHCDYANGYSRITII